MLKIDVLLPSRSQLFSPLHLIRHSLQRRLHITLLEFGKIVISRRDILLPNILATIIIPIQEQERSKQELRRGKER